jgi:hypothetical protein
MSSMRGTYDVAAFIKAYTEAVDAGLTLAEIATLLGLSTQRCSQRVLALNKRGIPLPKRKHGLAGKPGHPCPFKGQPHPARGKARVRRLRVRAPSSQPAATGERMQGGRFAALAGVQPQPSVTVTPGFVITVAGF